MSDEHLKPIVIIGGGGHASVLVDILLSQGRTIKAVICPDEIRIRPCFSGILHYKNNDDVLKYSVDEVLLVNGIGMLPSSSLKQNLNRYFLSLGYQFETVISDSAQISEFSKIATGAQILSSAVIQAGSIIGEHSIVNSGAIIEHDCNIGSYNHIAPRSTLCGGVTSEENVFIGASVTIIPNVTLSKGCIVGAGTIILEDVGRNLLVYSDLNQKKKVVSPYDR